METKQLGNGITEHTVTLAEGREIIIAKKGGAVEVDMEWKIKRGEEIRRGARWGVVFMKNEKAMWEKEEHGGLAGWSEGCKQVTFTYGSWLALRLDLRKGEVCELKLTVKRS